MSKAAQLTADQVEKLAPYERHFEQATQAAWCSYPGQHGINEMLDTWAALTGSPYPYQPGCAHCLLNLVRDIGTLYFIAKDKMPAKVAETPVNGTKGSKTGKRTGKKKAGK